MIKLPAKQLWSPGRSPFASDIVVFNCPSKPAIGFVVCIKISGRDLFCVLCCLLLPWEGVGGAGGQGSEGDINSSNSNNNILISKNKQHNRGPLKQTWVAE